VVEVRLSVETVAGYQIVTIRLQVPSIAQRFYLIDTNSINKRPRPGPHNTHNAHMHMPFG